MIFRGPPRFTEPAAKLYAAAIAQARRGEFYRALGVPDSVQGRFEMVALHVFLLLHRLKGGGAEAAALAQELFDTMFADLDQNLRELGVGDLSVGREIRALAESFYGRIAAYDRALAAGGLEEALSRNILEPGQQDAAAALAAYVRGAAKVLQGLDLTALKAGEARFGLPPAVGPGPAEAAEPADEGGKNIDRAPEGS
ncbi:MAG: ubiquinol-cytochrome C chaperone family protein [Alphaproteobacteria bacterium]